MDEIIVGISGINAVDNPGPGIGVARSLKDDPELKVRIVGLAYDAMEPGIYMDWIVDKSYLMPYPSCSGEAYIDRLLYIKGAYGLDVVIPNLDCELPVYIKYADALSDHGIGTFLPSMTQFRLRGKDKLHEIADAIGLVLPRTKVVSSTESLVAAVEEIGLPVMVKGIFYKAHRAYTTQEAVSHYGELVAEWGYPIIVQEVVTGDELNVVGVGDGQGGSMGLVAVKKILITSLGKIWTGVTVRNEPLLQAAERLIRQFRWRGPFELECMVHGENAYLLEINPRFPAWSYFASGVGINLPARLLRRSLGMPVPSQRDYPAGKLFIRYTSEMVTDMTRFQNTVTSGETL